MRLAVSENIIRGLIDTYPTPFYFYNLNILEHNINQIKQAFPTHDFQLLYATMANDNIRLLEFVNKHNIGACVNSLKHLNLVLESGFPTQKIHFTSTGLPKEDMALLCKKGITVNFDSLNQLKNWFAIKKGLTAGLRINVGSFNESSTYVDRLGIDYKDIDKALKIAENHNGIINGIHVYIGTNYKSHEDMIPVIGAFMHIAEKIPNLDYVNIGGGIGVAYLEGDMEFDLSAYGREVCKMVDELRSKKNKSIQLIFEPGRKIAAESGGFITKVTDIKKLRKSKYVIVDASVAVFPRSFIHSDSHHNAKLLFNENFKNSEETWIVGRTTFSKDIISQTKLPKNITIGDFILFDNAGAYCDSMRLRFLGQEIPDNIFING